MVQVKLDLDKELLFKLMLLAHEADLTLNQFCNKILRKYIKKLAVIT